MIWVDTTLSNLFQMILSWLGIGSGYIQASLPISDILWFLGIIQRKIKKKVLIHLQSIETHHNAYFKDEYIEICVPGQAITLKLPNISCTAQPELSRTTNRSRMQENWSIGIIYFPHRDT